MLIIELSSLFPSRKDADKHGNGAPDPDASLIPLPCAHNQPIRLRRDFNPSE